MNDYNWRAPMNDWMGKRIAEHFTAWRQTKQGKNWKPGKGSPANQGWRHPAWCDDLIDALNKSDEERAKAIRMVQDMLGQ